MIALNKPSLAIEEIQSFHNHTDGKCGIGYIPHKSSQGPLNAASTSGTKRVFVKSMAHQPQVLDKGKRPIEPEKPQVVEPKSKPKGETGQNYHQARQNQASTSKFQARYTNLSFHQDTQHRFYQARQTQRRKSHLIEPTSQQPLKQARVGRPAPYVFKGKGPLNPNQHHFRLAAPKPIRKNKRSTPIKN